MWKNFGQPVFLRRFLKDFILSLLAVLLCSYYFYRSLWAIPFLTPVGGCLFLSLWKQQKEKEKTELAMEFRECILAVVGLLQAGYSAEHSFCECRKDMELIFGGDAGICRELGMLQKGLAMNVPLEGLLADMGRRTECEEIAQFAQVFALVKRNGGNMAEVISNSAELIGRKSDLKRELQTLLSGKKMELLIMRGMPFAMISYVEVTTPGYFQVLYQNPKGILIMSGCLLLYLISWVWGEKVMENLWKQMSW